MSRFYRVNLAVNRFTPERKSAIIGACCRVWEFVPDCFSWDGSTLTAENEGFFTAGMLESELAEKLAQTIWEANQGYCEVTVTTTYLEEPPTETYRMGRKQFRAWNENQKQRSGKRFMSARRP